MNTALIDIPRRRKRSVGLEAGEAALFDVGANVVEAAVGGHHSVYARVFVELHLFREKPALEIDVTAGKRVADDQVADFAPRKNRPVNLDRRRHVPSGRRTMVWGIGRQEYVRPEVDVGIEYFHRDKAGKVLLPDLPVPLGIGERCFQFGYDFHGGPFVNSGLNVFGGWRGTISCVNWSKPVPRLESWCSDGLFFRRILVFGTKEKVNGTSYSVKLKYDHQIVLEDLFSLDSSVNKSPAIQFLDILVKSMMREMKFVEIGRNS